MKPAWILVLALSVSSIAHSEPSEGDHKGAVGIGLILGEPSGVTGKLYLPEDTAITATIGGSFFQKGIYLGADFLWHPFLLQNNATFVMPFYFGVGALIGQKSTDEFKQTYLGGRVPAGLLFDFRSIPIDLFAEAAFVPRLRISGRGEKTSLSIHAGFGARYYF